jgi:4-diphosphocytidyl-2-C-methyl-D-erythritol kinase
VLSIIYLTFVLFCDYKKLMYTIIEKACAKINLHLNVLNRRGDGYHDIFTLMAGLDLHDLVILEYYDIIKGDNPPEVKIDNGGGTYGHILDGIDIKDNLITKAVSVYLKKRGLTGTLHFVLEKNIPQGAGLAGGSSDAAAALRAVSRVIEEGGENLLSEAAIETGSDIPFCLKGGLAFAEMKGERIIPLDRSMDGFILLVNKGIEVNTGYAYSLLKRGPGDYSSGFFESARQEVLAVLDRGISSWREVFRNDFEEPVFAEYPQLGVLKNEIYAAGADFSAMSGSGSTIFGIFQDENACKEAFRFFEKDNNRCFFSKFAIPGIF